MLEPDIGQIETFTGALFRYARKGAFVSLRAFTEEDNSKPFHISAVAIGSSLDLLNNRAGEIARIAANHSAGVVFCPPIASFGDRKRAREIDSPVMPPKMARANASCLEFVSAAMVQRIAYCD